MTVDTGRDAVCAGDYRALVVVPEDASSRLLQLKEGLLPAEDTEEAQTEVELPSIRVFLDPGLTDNLKTTVLSSLSRAVLAAEMSTVLKGISEMAVDGEEDGADGKGGSEELVGGDTPSRFGGFFTNLDIESVSPEDSKPLPTSTQQNVPAWTMFAMFFLVVPLAGQFIAERDSGIQSRLLALPISYLQILAARIVVYLLVSLSQFALLLAVGFFILPLFGVPPLEIGGRVVPLLLVAASAGLAATGYGVAVGTIAQSNQQASTFGAVSVVIAAALGGVMVPVFAMPATMQKLSMLSPLAWGLNGFLGVFLRDAGIADVILDVLFLLSFFIVTICVSLIFRRWGRQ